MINLTRHQRYGGPRWAALFVVAVATMASGAAAGRLRNRWGKPDEAAGAADRIAALPEHFGDWDLQESRAVGPSVAAMLQCYGALDRTYRHRASGQSVSMFLSAGPPGPSVVHTPAVCYTSANYVVINEPRPMRVRKGRHAAADFWEVQLQKEDLQGAAVRVVYAWNAGAGWLAPEHPRFAFGGKPVVYRLQIASTVNANAESESADLCRTFLQDSLPILDEQLLPRQ
jgi:hypothetical protein